jgi:RNA polymerase sigma-70 factor (ECF subfamily)
MNVFTGHETENNIMEDDEQHNRHDGKNPHSEFEAVWQKFYPKLMVFVRPFLPDFEDREDACQEILMKVFRSFDRYDRRYCLGTWIYTIARNHCINCMKSKALRKKTEYGMIIQYNRRTGELNPEDQALEGELKKLLRDTLSKLDKTDQQICYLSHYEELSYGEIGKIVAMPLGTIKYRMHAIRKKIKDAMGGLYEDSD